ncbi:MAG: hypothetical protein NTY33_00410 [Candidatus Moranbacteria bacterium]|nr:hypothetical protein [Candidatus Moranbacteria bacterium]
MTRLIEKIAVIITALAIVFLPTEFFSILREEAIRACVLIGLIGMVFYWRKLIAWIFFIEFLVVTAVENMIRLFFRTIKKFDIRSLTIGVIIYQLEDKFFDYFVYSAVIMLFGPIYGGAFMIGVSIVINLIYLLVYDWIKKDWLGMEALKETQKDLAAASKWVTWVLSKGYWPTLVLLSWKFSPFVTTAYMRAGIRQYNGMRSEDWRTFWRSILIGNLFWILAVYTGISIASNINYSSFKEIILVVLFLTNAFFEGREI